MEPRKGGKALVIVQFASLVFSAKKIDPTIVNY